MTEVEHMLLYAVILFAAAVLFFGVGASIYRGNTRLIHDYHQRKVREENREAYGRAIARGLFVLGAALLLSGIIALCGAMPAALAALLIGLAVSIGILIRVQKKYNGGLF